MSSYQSASQRASRQAAAELEIDEGDAPFHQSRQVTRLALGDDDAAILAAAGPVRPRDRAASLHVLPPSPTVNAAAAPPSATEREGEGSWQAVQPSGSPLVRDGASGYTSHGATRNGSVTELANGSGNASLSNHRHLERMALPRDARGVPFEPSQPNYGQVLSFAEEEARDRRRAEQRQQAARSPRTPRASVSTPRTTEKPQSLSSTTASRTAPAAAAVAATSSATPTKPRPLSAAQLARLEKLAAPKRQAEPAVEPEHTPYINPTSSLGGSSSGVIFDRLYASQKQQQQQPSSPMEATTPRSSPTPRSRYASRHTPVSVASTQSQEMLLQRLSQPKRQTEAHRDASGVVTYNPYGSVKRYYGGTTPITGATAPAPAPVVVRGGNPRIPNVTWDAVDRRALPRATPAASSAVGNGTACVECGHALPQQTVEVVTQPSYGPPASAVEVLPPRSGAPGRPVAATTATSAVQVSAPTVVASAPAKTTGSRPPIVVRTRRFVPQSEEEEGDRETTEETVVVAAAPQPVEATRRRTVSASASRASPAPEAPPAPPAAVVVAATSAPAPATREAASAPTPPPAAPLPAVAHSVKAAPPTSSSAAEPTTRPVVQATRRRSSSNSLPAPAVEPSAEAAPTQEEAPPPPPAPVESARPAAVQATRRAPRSSPPPPPPPPAAEAAPAPVHGVVQAVRREPRAPSPPAPAAAPVATTTTLTPALPPPAPAEKTETVTLENDVEEAVSKTSDEDAAAESSTKDSYGVKDAHESDGEGEQLWRVAPPMAKSSAAPKTQPMTSVYDRLAPPPLPVDKLKTPRHTYKKKCVRPPKPEVLKEEEFACRLDDSSPEPLQPVVIHKKPKTVHKKAAKSKKL